MNRYLATLLGALAVGGLLSLLPAAHAQAPVQAAAPEANALRAPEAPPATSAESPAAEPPAASPEKLAATESADNDAPKDDLTPQPAEIRAELEARLKALDAVG